jgi:hypothetical protein
MTTWVTAVREEAARAMPCWGIFSLMKRSFAGDADCADFNQTSLQPVIAYTTSQAWTFTLQGEDTYYWETGEWSAPVNFLVSKIVKIPHGLRAGACAAWHRGGD